MRPLPLACVAMLLAVADAGAEPWPRNGTPAGGTLTRPLESGFIELLVTGRDAAARFAPVRPAPLDPATGQRVDRAPGGFATPQRTSPRAPAALRPAQTIDPRFARQVVSYDGREPPGSVVIDTPARFLYLVQEDGTAIRYGIGVGRPGFTWAGLKTITLKREWPDWRPPPEMLRRRPDLPRYMAGGPDNPLGARALYLGSSLYRIHGTNEPETIGHSVSSGCIRMLNEDVVDLYGRVRIGTRVLVI